MVVYGWSAGGGGHRRPTCPGLTGSKEVARLYHVNKYFYISLYLFFGCFLHVSLCISLICLWVRFSDSVCVNVFAFLFLCSSSLMRLCLFSGSVFASLSSFLSLFLFVRVFSLRVIYRVCTDCVLYGYYIHMNVYLYIRKLSWWQTGIILKRA